MPATYNVTQKQILKESLINRTFVSSIDSTNDTLVIGSASQSQLGYVYVYAYQNNEWIKTKTYSKSGFFGIAVAVHGDWLAISDTNTYSNGKVYVYRRNSDGTWPDNETYTIEVPIALKDFPQFGKSISLNNNTLAIGHRQYNNVGGAHIYNFDGTNWIRNPKPISVVPDLTRVDTVQNIGMSVSLTENCIVVGGPGDTIGRGKGIAVVSFRDTNNNWSQPIALKPDLDSLDGFGFKVTVKGSTIIISSPWNVSENKPRYVYVYKIENQTITFETKIAVSANSDEIIQDPLYLNKDNMGYDIDITNDENVIFASSYTRNNNNGIVYVFEKVDGVWTKSSLPNSWLQSTPDIEAQRLGYALSCNDNGVFIGSYTAPTGYWFK